MATHRPGSFRANATQHRKTMVARLRLRGMMQEEIAVVLATPGEDGYPVSVNPHSGKPWSQSTISNDCIEQDKQWRASERVDTDLVRGRVWGEMKEVRRAAWQLGDLDLVLKSLKAERELLGLDAPRETVLTATLDWQIEIIQAISDGDLTIDQVKEDLNDQLFRELFESSGAARLALGEGTG